MNGVRTTGRESGLMRKPCGQQDGAAVWTSPGAGFLYGTPYEAALVDAMKKDLSRRYGRAGSLSVPKGLPTHRSNVLARKNRETTQRAPQRASQLSIELLPRH